MAYPSNVSKILKIMGYKSFVDYIVSDDGDGPYIDEWMHENTMPTEEEVNNFYALWLESNERIADLRRIHKDKIDQLAADIRKVYITTTDGQELVYTEKSKDAQAYKDAGYPDEDIEYYPWIEAEAQAINGSFKDAADIILATRDFWLSRGVEIEKQRIMYKRLVDNAQTINEIEEVEGNYISAFENLGNS